MILSPAKKRWLLVLCAFFAGLLMSGGIGGYLVWRLVAVINLERDLSAAAQARTTLLYVEKIDRGTTNDIAKLRENGRERLSNYVHDVEQSKRDGRKLDEMTLDTYQAAKAYLFPFTFAEKREEKFFWEKMLPLAQEFIHLNKLPTANCGTNNIGKYRINFFEDGRSGCTADLNLKDGYSFNFLSNGTNAEVWAFSDGKTKTYYALEGAPKEKIEAIKALNLQNKLNKTSALKLAENFFKLQGHKEENFHPPELHQSYWSGGEDNRGGELPYYEVKWYRKDVKMADRDAGFSQLPVVIIEVSGIDSHLISYTKAFMPLGSDF